MSLKDQINKNKLPQHVAIIMDGNGRWAKQRGNKRIFGHKNGVTAVRDTVEGAAEIGIKYLTLYAFSTENWNRPRNEIDALMHLLVSSLNSEIKTLMKNNIRLLTIGDIESFMAKRLGQKWIHLRPREKYAYFSPRTIRRLLESEGFKVIEIGTKNTSKLTSLKVLFSKLDNYNPGLSRFFKALVERLGLSDKSIYLNFFDTKVVYARRKS